MTGLLKCGVPTTISMKKGKALAKKEGVSFNDMVLALQSVALKEYFLK